VEIAGATFVDGICWLIHCYIQLEVMINAFCATVIALSTKTEGSSAEVQYNFQLIERYNYENT